MDGTSIENNSTLYRINELRKVKCYNRFISFEPLLEKLENINLKNIDWVIIGGESDPNYRAVEEDWIWNLIKQCKKQKVKVFFKQWGGPRPKSGGRIIRGKTFSEFPKPEPLKITHQKKYEKLKDNLENSFERKKLILKNLKIKPLIHS